MALDKSPREFTMQKCERCSSPATVHVTEVLSESKFEEHHLCEQHYKEYAQESQGNPPARP